MEKDFGKEIDKKALEYEQNPELLEQLEREFKEIIKEIHKQISQEIDRKAREYEQTPEYLNQLREEHRQMINDIRKSNLIFSFPYSEDKRFEKEREKRKKRK